MRYLGGKSRTAKHIVPILEATRYPGQPFIEPFCGGLWITEKISGERYCSDGNKALITLYQQLQKGWIPPDFVSEEEYQKYKKTQDPLDPMTAFVGIGGSFGGKWFAGYARDPKSDRNYFKNAKNSLLKKIKNCKTVNFEHQDYIQAFNGLPPNSLIYLDPPYENTTGYAATGSFDSGIFWSIVRKLSSEHTVFVSEYSAPPDFKCVAEFPTKTDLGGVNKIPRVERLFQYVI